MEPERIRSGVIARLMGFDDLQRPLQTAAKKQRFLSDNYRLKVAMIGAWGEKPSSKQGQEQMRVVSTSETRKREKQPNGFAAMENKKYSSGFLATPTKELCRAYLQKSTSFASKHVIDAQATPPHRREKGLGWTRSHIHGEMANHINFGRRVAQQNSKSVLKPKHPHPVNPVKPKIWRKENSLRSFSPVSAPRGSHLGDRTTVQFLSLGNKAKERKKLFDGTTLSGVKEKYTGKVVSNSMVSTSRDLGSSLGQIGNEMLAAEVKLRLASSPRYTSKDEHDNMSHCSGTYPDCQTNLEESNQPSPVSVLEPIFDGEILEIYGKLPHNNLLGLEQQLEMLESESVETFSEGSGMVVSSDDESDEESQFDSESKEHEENKPIRSLVVQESQDSSYTDNVLAEAGLGNGKWIFNKWNSVDLLINPLIFEKLEKKYVEQTSWRRSERRLLFDRVNAGLVEILESYIAAPRWKKPVARRLGTMVTTQGLKEELQKLIARQEMQSKKESSAKTSAIDGDQWLELEADVEPVVRELETTLVDELLDELVTMCRV